MRVNNSRRTFVLAGAIPALAAVSPGIWAQATPDRTITIVVPQAPGGAVDLIARAAAEYMGTAMSTPVIVVNRPGAAGEIAAAFVAAAPADGNTILAGNSSTMVVAPQVKKTRYDPIKDFRPLGGIVIADTLLVTNKATGFKSIDDVVAYAKANPGKLAYSSNGVGGAFHLAMEYFQSLTGTKMLHVPFNGAAPAQLALMSNDVGVMVANTSSTLQQIRAGTIVPLAVVSSTPSPDLPDLPLGSSLLPNFVANTWVGFYAPAATPDTRAQELNAVFERYAKDPKGIANNKARGFISVSANLAEAAEFARKEAQTWSAIVAAARKNGPIE